MSQQFVGVGLGDGDLVLPPQQADPAEGAVMAPVCVIKPPATRPPIRAMMPPAVGDTELAITSLSPATTCGSAADSDARKNRFTASTSR